MSTVIAEHKIKLVLAANDVVEKLDSSIRADAFRFLIEGGETDGALPAGIEILASPMPNLTDFFKDRRGGNPSSNAVLVAGYLFSLYGEEPFTIEEIRQIAKQVGLIVPTRLDMTFVAAQRDGRSLFTRAGTGAFRPTVNGELHFQREGILKGSRARPTSSTASK